MLNGLNHITLSTSDLHRSLHFYIDVLGFTGKVKWRQGAYLSSGELWLCLSLSPTVSRQTDDYTHIAFDILPEHFLSMQQRLEQFGVKRWKENRSEGQSIYILDPDGHKLEIHVGSLQSRLESLTSAPYEGLVWMD